MEVVKFSQEEIELLTADGWAVYDGCYADRGGDTFRSNNLQKTPNGVLSTGHYPVNVDMDDGRYDLKYYKITYSNIGDAIARRNELTRKEWIR